MTHPAYERVEKLAQEDSALEQTILYVSKNLLKFMRKNERVLICFPKHEHGSLGWILEQAVRRTEGNPMFWGPDYRWKALLRQAFSSKATVIMGPPLIILGLAKLAKATGTPLYIRNVLTAGYPCMDWMIEGIQKGLDCNTWGCFGPGTGAVVSGFSCEKNRGIHLRQDSYQVEIVDDDGNLLPPGSTGEVILIPKADPFLRYPTMERGRLDTAACPCGSNTVRLMDIGPGRNVDPTLAAVAEQLHSWSSILDCRLNKGPYGLELELITFPGKKLPKLPSCAKQVVRRWDPERDMPFWHLPGWKNAGFYEESH